MNKKLSVLGYAPGTGRGYPFDSLFDTLVEATPVAIEQGQIQALVLWGGADISPSIYGDKVGKWTGAEEGLSARDRWEVALARAAIANEVPIIGVCRGAQLICALAGGKLVQHVNGHAGQDHQIITNDGRVFTTNSLHHQMQYPFGIRHEMLAWSKHRQSDVYLDGDNKNYEEFLNGEYVEPEIVYYPKIKALGIQGHPEFMPRGRNKEYDAFIDYCLEKVNEFLI